jgi:hypothetical protein
MTAEADKQRKLMEERAKGQSVAPAAAAPAEGEGEGGGKGDLQLPQ